MISGIFGLPGSGKSLFLGLLADKALHGKPLRLAGVSFGAFKKYDRVFTNFPFSGAYKLDFDRLGYVDMSKSLVLIDEIMMFADSRNFQTFGENLKFFFSQHRKMRIDVIYCSQAYDDVDKKIRNLTDSYYYISRWLLGYSVVKPIKAFFRVSEGQISSGYDFGAPLNFYWMRRKKYFKMIDTNYMVAAPQLEAYSPELWDSGIKIVKSP